MPQGITSGSSPSVVKTALDKVLFQEFERAPGPNLATPDMDMIFRQETIDRQAVITEINKPVGFFESRGEEQSVHIDNARVGDQQTFTVLNYDKSLPIPKIMFDDDQWGTVKNNLREMGRKASLSKIKDGMGVYRNAFTTTLTNDGAALASDTHTTLSGATVDNLSTAALTEASLNDMLVKLLEQKDQNGDIAGHEAHCLLVPSKLFKTACEVTGSELRSGSADNDLNVFSTKYNIYVVQSNFLGAAAGGSDTAHFLLARNHSVTRWVREQMWTDLVDFKYQSNNSYIYKAGFREVYGAMSYEGLEASNGTT